MSLLALRILLIGSRAASVVVLIRVLGFTLASLLLLVAIAANGALDARTDRTAWRDNNALYNVGPAEAVLQVLVVKDAFRGETIDRVLVAGLKPNAPVPPGLPRVPAPGDVFVSPAAARIIAGNESVLLPRYGNGRITGEVGSQGLADAAEKIVVVGIDGSGLPRTGLFFSSLPAGVETSATLFLRTILIVGATALIVPIMLFIAAAARLDAETSEARLSAFRLAGATSGQVRRYVFAESLLTALPGALIGFVLFFGARGVVARLQLDGHGFFPSDFKIDEASLGLLVLIPISAFAASLVGLRNVEISPLGVSRRSEPKQTRPLGPPFVALGFICYAVGLEASNDRQSGTAEGILVGVGVISIMLGLALLGPWLGQTAARLLLPRTGSPTALLALRRIVAEPHTSFRTVSGVTLAVFISTLFLALAPAIEGEVDTPTATGMRQDVFSLWRSDGSQVRLPALEDRVEVVEMETLFWHSASRAAEVGIVVVGDCEALTRVYPIEGDVCGAPVIVRAGGTVVPGEQGRVESNMLMSSDGESRPLQPPPVSLAIPTESPTFDVSFVGSSTPDVIIAPGVLPSPEQRGGVLLPGSSTVVLRDGQDLEAVRSAIIQSEPAMRVLTASEAFGSESVNVSELRRLTHLGTFGAFAFSGATGALAVGGSIISRRRPLALLRMSGVPVRALQRSLLAEALLPLILVSLVSVITALAAAWLAVEIADNEAAVLSLSFALPLLAGLALGLTIALLTLPFSARVTSMEQTRFE